MIHPVALFYAAACALTLWAASRARLEDRADAVLAGAILTLGCLLSNIAWARNGIGNWIRIDAGAMLLILWVLWRTLRPWKIVLASLAVATMGVHTFVEWLGDRSEAMMYAYPAALNAIFVLQLLCVASNGAKGARENGSGWLVFTWPRRPGDNSRLLRRSARAPAGREAASPAARRSIGRSP